MFSKRLLALLATAGFASASLAATPLIDSIKAGDSMAAIAIINQGVNVNEAEPDGTTPLHWAVYHNDHSVAERLLRAEADVNAENVYDSSPLREAAFVGDLAMVRRLLDAGADVDSPNDFNQTTLMIVARTDNVQLARLLIEHGANVNAREIKANQSALMWAAANGQAAMARLLIDHGAELDARTLAPDWDRRVTAEPRVKYMPTGGFTPLLFATRENCLDCVKALLDAGADIDKRDPDGTTALNLAVQNGHFDLAKFLIEQGADVNYWDWWGRGPLYSAVDMSTLPSGGRAELPPLDRASALDIVTLLLERGANPNLQLKFLVPFRNVGADRGGDLVFITGATPLLRAAKAGDLPVARLLLEHGALTELHTYGNWLDWAGGTRALPAAAGLAYQINDTRGQSVTQEQAIAMIDLLLEHGADLEAQDNRGRTAVHGAIFRGWDQVLEHLAKRGADLRKPDFAGATPMDAAEGTIEIRNRETITISPTTKGVLARLLEEYPG